MAGAERAAGTFSGGLYAKHPEVEATHESMMERDNQNAVAAARKSIEAERKAHRCYVCGRQDLPRWCRWFGLWAAVFVGLFLYFSETNRDTGILGYVAAALVGVALAAGMYEGIKPEDEAEARRKFNEKPYG